MANSPETAIALQLVYQFLQIAYPKSAKALVKEAKLNPAAYKTLDYSIQSLISAKTANVKAESSSSEESSSEDEVAVIKKPVASTSKATTKKISPVKAANSSSSSSSSSSEDEEPTVAALKTNGKAKAVVKTKAAASSEESSSSEDEKPTKPVPAPAKASRKPIDSSSSSSSSSSEDDKPAKAVSAPAKAASKPVASSSSSSSSSDEEAPAKASPAKSAPIKAAATKAVQKAAASSSSSSSSSSEEEAPAQKEKVSLVHGGIKRKAAPSSSSSSSDSSDEEEIPAKAAPAAKKAKTDKPQAEIETKTETISGPATIAIDAPAIIEIKEEKVTIKQEPFAIQPKNNKGKERTQNQPFRRVKEEDVQFHDERLRHNGFEARGGGMNDYGARAHNDLIVTRGDGFRKEKNKKKRGSYRGGEITMQSHSIKF